MLLHNTHIIISGAASPRGIGRAAARQFATHGARVAVLDVDATGAEETAEQLGPGHLGIGCDVRDADACQAAVQTVIDIFGTVDVVCNNAGVTEPVKLMDIAPAGWERVLTVNLKGTLNLSRAAIPHLKVKRAGSIICMSSVSAQRGGGIFGGPHYSAAKAGVLGLAKAMARELGPFGIRVNAIAPGLIETDITQGRITDEMRAEIEKGIVLGRLGKADDVAGVYVFLASPLSAYLTGAVIDVNGGMLIHG